MKSINSFSLPSSAMEESDEISIDRFPLHLAQQEVYFDQITQPQSPHYNVGGYVVLKGKLHKDHFTEAVKSLSKVFDAYAMQFSFKEEQPFCYFDAKTEIHLSEKDFSNSKHSQDDVLQWMQERFNVPFHLEEDRLYEQALIKINEEEHWWYMRYHHLLTDGYGFVTFQHYVAEQYNSLLSTGKLKTTFNFPEYKTETKNSQDYINTESYQKDATYWQNIFSQLPDPLIKKNRKSDNDYVTGNGQKIINIPQQQREKWDAVTNLTGSSIQQLTLAALTIYFGKADNREELVFGTTLHKRRTKNQRKTVGMFSGMLPFKGKYDDDQTLENLIKQIKKQQRSDYRYQNYPISHLNRSLKLLATDRDQLFEVVVNYATLDFELNFDGIKTGNYELSSQFEKIPLQLWWRDYGKQQDLELRIDYGNEYFSSQQIDFLSDRILFILDQFEALIHSAVSEIEIIPSKEKDILFQLFGPTTNTYKDQKSIIQLFEEQVHKNPDKIALSFGEEKVSYAQLNEKVNQLANYISKRAQKDSYIAICQDRSIEMIISLLAIIKSNCTYVPLDPEYPEDRIKYILEDTKAVFVLTQYQYKSLFENINEAECIFIDKNQHMIDKESRGFTSLNYNPDQLLYTIFTSGTTGKPKGVKVGQASVFNLIESQSKTYGISEEENILLFSNIVFDASVEQIFLALLNGAQLTIISKEQLLHADQIDDLINSEKITHLDVTPTFLENINFKEDLPLKRVVVGGEACPGALAKEWGNTYPFYNAYGPTEATVTSLIHKLDSQKEYSGTLPIGIPIDNTSILVLNPNKEVVPMGHTGELYLGGSCLSKGYLNNEALTAEKFVTIEFRGKEKKFYRTGDLVKLDHEGIIYFQGRIDEQVKIRGNRIELEEIESVLYQSTMVKQAAINVLEDKFGQKHLAAYIAAENGFDKQEIRQYLEGKLPRYMVPSFYKELKELPVNTSGKVDKKQLPAIQIDQIKEGNFVEAQNPTQQKLINLWKALLPLDNNYQIGIRDHFFELGGHSLLATRLVSSVKKAFSIEISIKDIFTFPTIVALAEVIQGKSKSTFLPDITKAYRPEKIPMSFSQERIWFIDKLEGSTHYHMPGVFRLKGKTDKNLLELAFRQIIHDHEALRTILKEEKGIAYQEILPKNTWTLNHLDHSEKSASETEELIDTLSGQPFDLSIDHMIRVHLIDLNAEESILLIVLHHIAADGWSLSLFINELISNYNQLYQQKEIVQKELPIQYADYAIWQHQYLKGAILDGQLNYWESKLKGIAPLNLPLDFPRPASHNMKGKTVHFQIDTELTESVKTIAQEQDSTPFMFLISVFKVLMCRYSGQTDICVGTAIANRRQKEIEGLIGFFVNTLALRSDLSNNPAFHQLLQQVKNTTLEAYAYQDAPFDKIVERVEPERELNRNPLFQVMFVLQNTPEIPELKLGDVSLAMDPLKYEMAKFDLTFTIEEESNHLNVEVEYNTALFRESTILQIIKHYKNLLSLIAQNPKTNISELPILNVEEKNRQLLAFNNNKTEIPANENVVSQFETQVNKSPDKGALIFIEKTLTFKQLNQRSNQVARYLIDKGVNKNDLVALCIPPSTEMIVGILGVLKAGGAYVPIDANYPADRIQYILDDSKAQFILATNKSEGLFESNEGSKVISLEDAANKINSLSKENLNTKLTKDALAYIIYTSGSTGKPKGTLISHGSLFNYLSHCISNYDTTGNDTSGSYIHLSVTFDASVTALFTPLLSGKKIVVSSQTSLEVFEDPNFLANAPYDFIKLTPAHLQLIKPLVGKGLPLITKKYILGGEALQQKDFQHFIDEKIDVEIINEYGPTEATVGCTNYSFNTLGEFKNSATGILIGKPTTNSEIYILDEYNNLIPEGVVGELCISGPQLALGYLNKAALTEQKFIQHPFKKEAQEKLYKTGDLARWHKDGNLEFIGRIDDQVKINGYRIEPGEIENAALKSGLVNTNSVVVKQDESRKQLIHYFVPKKEELKRQTALLYQKQVSNWQDLYIEEYKDTSQVEDEEFNTKGWGDSFTGGQIPDEHMAEWLDDIISFILKEKPEKVLEIGCGTGMIFYRLADHIKEYTGFDLSTTAIGQIQERIAKAEKYYPKTRLKASPADQIKIAANTEIDTVVINSVIQYFPGEEYLSEIIANSMSYLKGKGKIIIGDVRHYGLLKDFRRRIALQKAADNQDIKSFNWEVERSILNDKELCVAPEFFYLLKNLYPEISHVDISYKDCQFENEMSLYRYNVIVHVGTDKEVVKPEWLSWSTFSNKSEFDDLFNNDKDLITITDVPNPRLQYEAQIINGLSQNSITTVGDLRKFIDSNAKDQDIEHLLQTASENDYQVQMWVNKTPNKVNLVFKKQPTEGLIENHFNDEVIRSEKELTNIPLFVEASLEIQKQIKEQLVEVLPEYMLPSKHIAVQGLPLTSNGKVDKSFLSICETGSDVKSNNYVPPTTASEIALADIWASLLQIEKVGIHDNFFEMGGDSIITIQVVSRAKQAGYQLEPKDIFKHQTIAALASALKEKKENKIVAEQGMLQGNSQLLPIQQWFLEKEYEHQHWFNQAVLLNSDKKISYAQISTAMDLLVKQHDALRFKFELVDNKWTQQYGDQIPEIEQVDLNTIALEAIPAAITEVCQTYQKLLDIKDGKLIKIVFIKTPDCEASNRLFITIHHLAVDGVSWRILLEQLENCLSAIAEGKNYSLGEKSTSYREWVNALTSENNLSKAINQLNYWKDIVTKYDGIPTDKNNAKPLVKDLDTKSFKLDKTLTQKLLQTAHQAYNTEINDILLAALSKTIHEWSQLENITIGLEGHGREDLVPGIDLSTTVGWFTTLFPVGFDLTKFNSDDDLLKSVKETVRNIPDKGIGYGILKYLHRDANIRRSLDGNPFDIIFNYLGQIDNGLNTSSYFSLADESVGSSTSDLYPFDHKLEINASVQEGAFQMEWRYANNQFEKQTIENLISNFESNLKALIDHCLSQHQKHATPSDYKLNQWVGYQELDRFLNVEENGIKRKQLINDIYPLSPMQEGMLFHGLYEKESLAYTEQTCIDLSGNIDLEALKSSWNYIINNHTILRSAIDAESFKIPVQYVYNDLELPFEVLDFSHLGEDEKKNSLSTFLNTDKEKGFNFSQPTLMRITLIKMSAVLYKMAWTTHHILVDGWTSAVIIEELLTAYQDLANGNKPFAKNPDHYRDFIDYLQDRDKTQEKQFWKQYLAEIESASLLPFISGNINRNKVKSKTKELILNFDSAQTAKIKKLSKDQHITINTILQGLWAILLSKYTAQKDIMFGVTVSGRPSTLENADQRVGLYINTIPLRAKVNGQQNLNNWLTGLQNTHAEAREYQHNGLNEIQKWSEVNGDLFDTLFVYENYPLGEALTKDWLLKMDNITGEEHTNYPLTIIAAIVEEKLSIKFNYNGLLFDETIIDNIKGHFEQALSLAINEPQILINELDVITEAEKSTLLQDLNNVETPFPKDQTIADLFEEQVRKYPESIALIFDNQKLTYAELDKKVNQLSNYLIIQGVKPGSFVGIYLDRSFDMVISILAVVKAGAVYVPIDLDYPKERVNYILKDAQVKFMISHSSVLNEVTFDEIDNVISLDEVKIEIQNCAKESPNVAITPVDSLYMMYTSGSTGKPKGVLTRHISVSRLVYNSSFDFLNESAVTYQYAPTAFDASTFEIWGALLKGGKVVIASPGKKSLDEIAAEIKENKVNILWLTAGLFHQAVELQPDLFEGLNYMLAGGDSIKQESIRKLLENHPQLTFINGYGPTESTTFAVVNKIENKQEINYHQNIIGNLIDNTKAYILEPNSTKLAPQRSVGELGLSGPGLAKGYHNQDTLTNEKFIDNPYDSNEFSKIYKTGDLVRWLPNGKLEFFGRSDQQVKIRGFRIELGEIEAALENLNSIEQAVVITKQDANKDKFLVAFVVSKETFDKNQVQIELSKQLPAHMIPSGLIALDEIPLSANGKVDRKALVAYEISTTVNQDSFVAPGNETEEQLAGIWKRLLSIEQVGIYDDFFELGGHSLLVTRMVSEIKNEFDIKLELKDLFELRDIASLSQHLDVLQSNTLVDGEEYEMIEL